MIFEGANIGKKLNITIFLTKSYVFFQLSSANKLTEFHLYSIIDS